MLRDLLAQADIFSQGYRPRALAALGFSPEDAARINPGIVYVSLSAYGHAGPWAERRGFDSLVQTSTGFNHAEGQAAGVDGPKELPAQMLDHATGYLMAFGAMMAKARQAREGGSWHVRVSLAQTGRWLWNLGRVADGFKTEDLKGDAVDALHRRNAVRLRSAAGGQPCGGAVENARPSGRARRCRSAVTRRNGRRAANRGSAQAASQSLYSFDQTLAQSAFLGCLKHQLGTISAAMRQSLPESSPN